MPKGWEETSEWQGPCRPEHLDAEATTRKMQEGLPDWWEMR